MFHQKLYMIIVIASDSEAISIPYAKRDCFVAPLLAMTEKCYSICQCFLMKNLLFQESNLDCNKGLHSPINPSICLENILFPY